MSEIDDLIHENERLTLRISQLVEIGGRMRAMQQSYFKTRNYKTLRDCMAVERQFDKLIRREEGDNDGVDDTTPGD